VSAAREPIVDPRRVLALATRVRLPRDRVSAALCVVFLLAAAFYLWLAGVTSTLSLQGHPLEAYNRLADAFLHLHLWVDRAPAGLAELPEPYNPVAHAAYVPSYPDYSLYGKHLYLLWGPVPALTLLVPLHVLGFEPSGGVIVAPFVIAGLGFALAALRVLLRQLGGRPLWMCLLAGCALALSSAVPPIASSALVYEQAIAGGYCFTMAGVWLALGAVVDGRASRARLLAMSLCIGLAAGSRPTLGLTALVLIPVYRALRATRPRRELLTALAVPFGACLLALAAYNQLRFGSVFQFGQRYQLNNADSYHAHWGSLSYIPPGVWSYLAIPPRLTVLFPFLNLAEPPLSYPFALPAGYLPMSELTGGLLPMAPVLVCLGALPLIWRRRPMLLGPLAAPLLILAGVGVAIMLYISYQIFSTTERYEVDFATLFLLGALAAWLALSAGMRGRARRLVSVGGGLLTAYGCLTGAAIALSAIPERALEDAGSPVSRAIAAVAEHPVLAQITAPNAAQAVPASYTNLGSRITAFWLSAGEQAKLTVVSSTSRKAALLATWTAGPALRPGASLSVRIEGPGSDSHVYLLPGSPARVALPLQLSGGINRLTLSPLASAPGGLAPGQPAPPLLEVGNPSVTNSS
jgi:hypothetical protein